MRVIEPIAVTTAVLTSTNVTEADYPAWASGTTYAVGARVILTSTHRIYESVVAGNINHNPATDAVSAYWLDIGATNRWKAFDRIISDPVVKTGAITYYLLPNVLADAIAFFGLAASSLTITATDPVEGVIYNETFALIDGTEVVDGWSYCFGEITYTTELVVSGIPIYAGVTAGISITSGGTTEVGEIVIGRDLRLGSVLSGSSVGIRDYSRKERDDFGNPVIVSRAYSDRVSFQFSFPTDDTLRIKRILARLRATAAVYFGDGDAAKYGMTVYGFYSDFDIPLTTSVSFGTLEIEGLT